MLENDLQQMIAADSGVKAILGNPARLYPVRLPEDPVYPCASYQVISEIPDYVLKGKSGLTVKRIQFDTWSGGETNALYADVKNAMAAIRAVIEAYAGTLPNGGIVAGIFVANSHDEFEQDARAYRCTMDVLVHYYPAAG